MDGRLRWLVQRATKKAEAEKVPPDVPELVIYIYRLQRALSELTNRSLERHAISHTEFEILQVLVMAERRWELTISDINEICLISTGGMAKAVRRLVERGYVEIRTNPNDGRSKQCALTAAGDHLIGEALSDVQAAERRAVGAIVTSDQLQQVMGVLKLLAFRLEH